MKSKKIQLGFLIFIIGAVGIMSMFFSDLPIPDEIKSLVESQFPNVPTNLLFIVNPTLMLIIATVTGTLFYNKAHFKMPILERIVGIKINSINLQKILSYGIVGGIISGLSLILMWMLFKNYLPESYLALSEDSSLSIAPRILYGGFTEEILMRFGLMTFVVYLLQTIFKNNKDIFYWLGILTAAIFFAFGHLPALYVFMDPNEINVALITFILVANLIAGIIFGWLYWKVNLETAFVAHAFAHITMLLLGA